MQFGSKSSDELLIRLPGRLPVTFRATCEGRAPGCLRDAVIMATLGVLSCSLEARNVW
jgi:hypothetical protein